MVRKIIAAVLLTLGVATAVGAIPGLLENVAYACRNGDSDC